MTDPNGKTQNDQTPPSDAFQQTAAAGWQEVGRQFHVLGESLADALRASWNEPENRQRVRAMQSDLEHMVKDVDAAITDAASSPHAQQARADARRTVESLRQVSEETIQDVRPRLLAALQQVNEELAKLVRRMENSGQQPSSGAHFSKDVPPDQEQPGENQP